LKGTYSSVRAAMGSGDYPTAKTYCAEILKATPQDPEAHYIQGCIALEEGNDLSAKESLERAVLLGAKSAGPYISLAYLASKSGNPVAAHKLLRDGLKKDKSNKRVFYALGQVCLDMGNWRDSKKYFEKVLTLDSQFIGAITSLIGIYDRTGELKKAETLLKRALTINPNDIYTLLTSARHLLAQGDFTSSLACINKSINLASEGVSGGVFYGAYSLRGAVNDAMGNYKDAFEDWSKSKKYIPDDPAREDLFVNHHTWFTRENLAKLKSPNDDVLRPIFLAGFARSGTTLLEQMLHSHKGICVSNESISFGPLVRAAPNFPSGLLDMPSSEFMGVRDSYWAMALEIAGPSAAGVVFVDKQPMNIRALGFIEALFPQSPMVIMQRDPRDVCISCFSQEFDQGGNYFKGKIHSIADIVDIYCSVMDAYLFYKKNLDLRLYEIKYENLLAAPETELKGVLQFMGLEWSDSVLSYSEKSRKRYIATPSYNQVTQPLYRTAQGRWKNYEKELAPYLERLDPYIKGFGYE